MPELLIGRQPIFHPKLDVLGYELLYRSVGSDRANVSDGDQATTQVILNSFSEVGLDNLVGDGVAYINATRNFLIGKYPIPLPADRVVLEVLENIPVDRELVDALKNLRQTGYEIALDDVVSVERVKPLVDIVSVIKVDILNINRNDLGGMVSYLKRYDVRLLAEKVETLADFNLTKHLGFDYFQGFFLCKPNIVKRRRIDTSRLVIMRSLAKLQDPSVNFQQLEEIVAQDVSLGYKLLKLVNSAYYSTFEPVKSIGQAIGFIGLDQMRGWMTLLLLASIENKPHELTTIAMSRAKMAELLARAMGERDQETYFLVGLFSVLDALMDLPMSEAIAGLPISVEVKDALLRRKGPMGRVLKTVLAYERGDWNSVINNRVEPDIVKDIYLKSIKWASVFSNALKTNPGMVASN